MSRLHAVPVEHDLEVLPLALRVLANLRRRLGDVLRSGSVTVLDRRRTPFARESHPSDAGLGRFDADRADGRLDGGGCARTHASRLVITPALLPVRNTVRQRVIVRTFADGQTPEG